MAGSMTQLCQLSPLITRNPKTMNWTRLNGVWDWPQRGVGWARWTRLNGVWDGRDERVCARTSPHRASLLAAIEAVEAAVPCSCSNLACRMLLVQ